MHSFLTSANFLHFKTKLLTQRNPSCFEAFSISHREMSIYTALFSRHKKKINIQFHSLKELKVKNALSDPREAKRVAFELISKQKFVLEKKM